jgi:sec-independent protein translocase protein TatC
MNKSASTPEDDPEIEQPFLSHLVELRDRLMRALIGVFIVFIGVYPFANEIYSYIAGPLLDQLPEGSTMIAIDVATPFLTPFKLAMVGAIFLTMPWILYQVWGFVAPGLYRHEKRLIMPLLFTSSVLFYLGIAFAYYIVFPLVFAFMTTVAPMGVEMMTDINRYLDFVLTIFFAFGLAFEVPIVTIVLVWTGATTRESLSKKRPYIIVGAFVIGMVLTPPDVISQTLLALPMWVLFELGILFARFYQPKEEPEAEDDDAFDETATAGDDPDEGTIDELGDDNHPERKRDLRTGDEYDPEADAARYTEEGVDDEIDELGSTGDTPDPTDYNQP